MSSDSRTVGREDGSCLRSVTFHEPPEQGPSSPLCDTTSSPIPEAPTVVGVSLLAEGMQVEMNAIALIGTTCPLSKATGN